jgi:hypothetical protein
MPAGERRRIGIAVANQRDDVVHHGDKVRYPS